MIEDDFVDMLIEEALAGDLHEFLSRLEDASETDLKSEYSKNSSVLSIV